MMTYMTVYQNTRLVICSPGNFSLLVRVPLIFEPVDGRMVNTEDSSDPVSRTDQVEVTREAEQGLGRKVPST